VPLKPVALLALTALVWIQPARADVKQACVNASSEGQALRDDGKLHEARDRFVSCARDECPSIVRKYCADWLTDIERRLPSAVFRVKGADGSDVLGGRLEIDGQPEAHGLDGTAVPLDPGEHAIRIAREGAASIEERIVIVEGERGRLVTLHAPLPPAPPAAPAVESASAASPGVTVTPLTLVLGGVGVVGLASFAYFGLTASGNLSHLRQTCAPYCAPSDLDSARREALFADVSLGVGLVALGLATYTLFAHRAPPAATALIDVRPTPGGAVAAVVGRF
jgi:hypothetical protein